MPKRGGRAVKRSSTLVKAVIPAAGLGTRFRPLTLAVPKELLPVNKKPMVQLAVEEALSSDIRDIGIVIRRGKEVIRDYINSLMSSSDSIWKNFKQKMSHTRVHYIFQEKPLGLGNAIYAAREYINDSPFVMIIPDQFVDSRVPATKQLLNAANKDVQAVWSSLTIVPPEEKEFFSSARSFLLTNRRGNTWSVKEILEHSQSQSGETILGFGRTYFPQGVIEFFSDRFMNPVTREVDLLFTFKALMRCISNKLINVVLLSLPKNPTLRNLKFHQTVEN